MDKIDVEAVRQPLRDWRDKPHAANALALIDQLTAERDALALQIKDWKGLVNRTVAERDALQAKVDAMQAAHQKFRQEVSDVVVNVLHHQEIGVPYFPGVLRNALTKFLVKTDPVEKAIGKERHYSPIAWRKL